MFTRDVWKVSDLNPKKAALVKKTSERSLLTVTHQSFGHFGRAVFSWQSFESVDVSVFGKIEKIEYRAIKFLFLKGTYVNQKWVGLCIWRLCTIIYTVKYWVVEFKRGYKSLGDIEHSGRPKTTTTDDYIANVHQLVLNDRRIKVT